MADWSWPQTPFIDLSGDNDNDNGQALALPAAAQP
jgi:hypothetical protein